MLFTLKEVQGEEQLAFLETAAESRRTHEDADKQMERQLKMLQETAPLFSELLNLTGRNGAIERMALGMLQGGASIGEVLVATADAEIKLEQAKLATQLQHKQIELQNTNSAALQTSVNLENAVRNSMTKQELQQQPAWVLLIDEYKGTVPLDAEQRKIYDQQLCEVARRGRGLKIHLIVGLQRGSKRTSSDPQALPPDLRDNLRRDCIYFYQGS
jgi:hypothetical protein